MKRQIALVMMLALALTGAAVAQAKAKGGNAELENVLNKMDAAAAQFKSAQADFVWDQYTKVIDETDTQKGTVYFRREAKDTDMAAEIKQPADKHVVFADGKVQVYEPKIDQVTVYNAGKNRAEFESFLVLGFGGRGHDLYKGFDVKYAGTENVGGVNTAKLELTPKAQKVRNMFERITLWIDPTHGVSVQQQFHAPGGDYRLAKYNNIKINEKVADTAFKLKTTNKTRTVTPQG